MSKYIIELDDRIKLVTSVGVTENGVVYTTSDYVHNLEELNSDYINEHFGELQDEAYQRGHDDGYEAGCATAFKPVSDAEYRRGFEDGKWKAEDGCDGCKYYEDTSLTNPCSECSRGCVDHYKPVSDPSTIKVGDIVERYIDGKLDSKGIFLQEEGGYWRCLFDTGAVLMTFAYPKGQFKKTGQHYDIASILEAMRT